MNPERTAGSSFRSVLDVSEQRVRKIFMLFALVLLAYAILRGIAFPNTWSATHHLINYDFGFVKRGLIGAFYQQIGCTSCLRYGHFFYLSATLFVANLSLLVFLLRDLIRSADTSLQVAALIYCSSAGVVFLANSIGYAEQFGLFIVLLALRLSGFHARFAWVAVAFPISLLVHEALFVLFMPVFLILFLLDPEVRDNPIRLMMLGAWLLLATGLTAFLGTAVIPMEDARQMYEALGPQTDYRIANLAFRVIGTDVDQTLFRMTEIWSRDYHRKSMIRTLLIAAPCVAFFWYRTWTVLSGAHARLWLKLMTLAAGLSPQALHFFGYDIKRWNTLTITTCFLVLCASLQILPRQEGKRHTGMSIPLLVLGVMIIATNMTVRVPVLVHNEDKNPPFGHVVNFFEDLVEGEVEFPWRRRVR